MPYTSQTISGYNANPPTDDGAQEEQNEITWAKHVQKLADPIKNLAEAINTAVVNAFNDKDGLNDAVFHSGMIMMWNTAIANIPSGWQLCDGTNGTPDLRDRFVIGAGDSHSPDDTGGSETHDHGGSTGGHALTESELAPHTHRQQGWGNGTASGSFNSSTNEGTVRGVQDTESTGDGDSHDHPIPSDNHLPPFYALAYIMKL